MGTLASHRTYCYNISGESDPLLELLAAPLIATVRGGRNLTVRRYCTTPADGILAVKTEKTPPHVAVAAIFKWLQSNPLTLMADYNLAVLVDKNVEPGSGLFPTATLAPIYEDSRTYREALYLAPAAIAVNSSRRGIDLIHAMLVTSLTLYGLAEGEPLEGKLYNTIEAVLQAYMYKLLAFEQSELRLKTLAVSKVTLGMPQNTLRELLKRFRSSHSERELRDTVNRTLSRRDVMRYLYGRYLGYNVRLPLNPKEQAKAFTKKLLERREIEARTVIVEATGQFSLADILLLASINAEKIYLTLTPETIPNLIHILLLPRDLPDNNKIVEAEAREETVKITVRNSGTSLTTILTPLITGQSIPHITWQLYKSILQQSQGKIIYIPGFATASILSIIEKMRTENVKITTIPELVAMQSEG
jgi:hypothetical protein